MTKSRVTPPEERFWRYVDRRGPDECWLWTGGRKGRGYGAFNPAANRSTYAHRFSLEMHLGRRLSSDECACHRCDNPPCVNPAHLFVGSQADNVRDMKRKGRMHTPVLCGEDGGRAILTTEQVRAIRAAPITGKYGEKTQLARQYGVAQQTIQDILRGRSWRHLL